MGLTLDQKHYEWAGDDRRWYFNLCGWSDPAADYTCFIILQHKIEGQWRGVTDKPTHQRHFEVGKFNRRHYANFRRKFAADINYRQRWQVTQNPATADLPTFRNTGTIVIMIKQRRTK